MKIQYRISPSASGHFFTTEYRTRKGWFGWNNWKALTARDESYKYTNSYTHLWNSREEAEKVIREHSEMFQKEKTLTFVYDEKGNRI